MKALASKLFFLFLYSLEPEVYPLGVIEDKLIIRDQLTSAKVDTKDQLAA